MTTSETTQVALRHQFEAGRLNERFLFALCGDKYCPAAPLVLVFFFERHSHSRLVAAPHRAHVKLAALGL